MNPPTTAPAAGREADPAGRRMEALVSRLLRAGVAASMLLVLAGVAAAIVHHPAYLTSAQALPALVERGAQFPHTIGQVARETGGLMGEGAMAAGLLLLIATPVLRVAVSVVGFALQRDWVYVALTAFVLAVLVGSLLLGKAG